MFYYTMGAIWSDAAEVTDPIRFPLHTWTHVAVVQDGTTASIYWNDTLKASHQVHAGAAYDAHIQLYRQQCV